VAVVAILEGKEVGLNVGDFVSVWGVMGVLLGLAGAGERLGVIAWFRRVCLWEGLAKMFGFFLRAFNCRGFRCGFLRVFR